MFENRIKTKKREILENKKRVFKHIREPKKRKNRIKTKESAILYNSNLIKSFGDLKTWRNKKAAQSFLKTMNSFLRETKYNSKAIIA